MIANDAFEREHGPASHSSAKFSIILLCILAELAEKIASVVFHDAKYQSDDNSNDDNVG